MTWIRPLAVLLAWSAVAQAADWPQWLGPRRDGSTPEKVAPWKDAPPVLWKQEVGEGYSCPVIAEGRVFVHALVKDKQEEEVVAFDAKTGEELWRATYPRSKYQSAVGSGPQATPAVRGNRLYTFGVTGVLSCYEVDSGKRLWRADVYKDFAAALPRFGVCCSPLVVGNRVYLSVGGQQQCVVAFDADTGKAVWQGLDEAASTSSPVLLAGTGDAAGLPDVVFMTPLRLAGVSLLGGQLQWEHPLVFQPSGTSPTPIVSGDLLVASTTAHGAVAIKVTDEGGKKSARQVWQDKQVTGYFSSGVAGGEYLYLVTNVIQPLPAASLRCVERATGKELWRKPSLGYFHLGVLAAGENQLLILDDRGGLHLAQADPKEYREVAYAKVCDGTLVNPALADGRVYVRDDKHLVCLSVAP